MLLQEEFQDDPWKMLIACIMLNQTGNKQVRKVIYEFFERWPSPKELIQADESQIKNSIKSLGLYNRRTKSIINFSKSWIEKGWHDGLPGIGQYAKDSYEIFQNKNPQIKSKDKILSKYLKDKYKDHD